MTFEEPGHPIIKILEDRISIKAIDYWEFRDFKFDNIKSIKLYRPYENSLLGFLFKSNPVWGEYREKDDFVLRINLKDGEHWDYKTVYNFSPTFKNLVDNLQSKLANE